MPDITGLLTREEAAELGMFVGRIMLTVEAEALGLPARKTRWVVCVACDPTTERGVQFKSVQGSQVLCPVHRLNANNPRHIFNRGPGSLPV